MDEVCFEYHKLRQLSTKKKISEHQIKLIEIRMKTCSEDEAESDDLRSSISLHPLPHPTFSTSCISPSPSISIKMKLVLIEHNILLILYEQTQ
jgi:hypothetical protein